MVLLAALLGGIANAQVPGQPENGEEACSLALVVLTTYALPEIAVRTEIAVVDLADGGIVNGPHLLPGRTILPDQRPALVGSPGIFRADPGWFVVSGPDRDVLYLEPCFPEPVMSIARFDAREGEPDLLAVDPPPSCRLIPLLLSGDQREFPFIPVSFETITGKDDTLPQYFLELLEGIHPSPEGYEHATGIAGSRWELGGKPLAAALAERPAGVARIAVLTMPAPRGLRIDVFSRGTAAANQLFLAIPDQYEAEPGTPCTLHALPDGTLLACWRGRKAGGTPAEGVTLLWGIDPEGGKISQPLVLHGTCRGIETGVNGFLWLVSAVPGTGDYYFNGITWHLEPDGDPELGLELERIQRAESPYTAMAVAETENALFVGSDRYVEKRTREGRGETQARYPVPGPVRSLAWWDNHVLVGAGNQLLAIDLAQSIYRPLVSFSSGQVTGIFPFTDKENLPEKDKKIEKSIKTTVIPSHLTFRNMVVGRELQVVHVECAGDVSWNISADTPEILFHPSSGRGTGLVYIGVEPAFSDKNGNLFISLKKDGFESIQTKKVSVAVSGKTTGSRTVLWNFTRDEIAPEHFTRVLSPMLEDSPFYARNILYTGAIGKAELDQADLLIADFDAFSKGLVPVAYLMNWLTPGKGLLLVARRGYKKEELAILGEQLLAMGIDVVLDSPGGTTMRVGDLLAVQRWNDRWQGDWWFRAASPDSASPSGWRGHALVSSTGDALWDFLLFRAGYGRIALVSSSTFFNAVSTGDTEAVGCSLAVIRWLTTAGQESLDADGDGLTDDLEDRDGNGIRDRSETDWTSSDTDGDGIPDGMEDRNRNGMTDAGETSPLLRDTDGDGIPDGADARPLIP